MVEGHVPSTTSRPGSGRSAALKNILRVIAEGWFWGGEESESPGVSCFKEELPMPPRDTTLPPPNPGQGLAESASARATGEESATVAVDIDWIAMKAAVIAALRGKTTADPGVSSRDRRRTEAAAFSYDDLVQEIIAEQYEAWQLGAPVPTDLEAIEKELVIRAKRRLKAWTKRNREQRKKLHLLEPLISQVDMFDEVAAHDEFDKLIVLIIDVLDPSAQVLLYLVLHRGIPFRESKALLDKLNESFDPSMTLDTVESIKRRITYHAGKILTQLSSQGRKGSLS
jgi:hypothetical protein